MLTYTAPEKKRTIIRHPQKEISSEREKKGWMQMINVMSSLQRKGDIYLKRKKKVKYTKVYHKERKEKGIGRVDRNNAESSGRSKS